RRMPIHDQGYRHYLGARRPSGRTWGVIAAAGMRSLLHRRGFVAVLLLSWLPFVFRAMPIWASVTFTQATFLAPRPETFRDFLDSQSFFVFFVAIFGGAGLIANDLRANALQIYL